MNQLLPSLANKSHSEEDLEQISQLDSFPEQLKRSDGTAS